MLSLRKCLRLSDGGLAALARNGALQQLSVNSVRTAGPALLGALTHFCKWVFIPSLK